MKSQDKTVREIAKEIRNLIDSNIGPRPDGAPLWNYEGDEIEQEIIQVLEAAEKRGMASRITEPSDEDFNSAVERAAHPISFIEGAKWYRDNLKIEPAVLRVPMESVKMIQDNPEIDAFSDGRNSVLKEIKRLNPHLKIEEK